MTTAPSIGGAVVLAIALLANACARTDESVESEPERVSNQRTLDTLPHVGWVGMFTPELVAHLENENRLAELCRDSADSAALAQCRAEKLEPDSVTIQLRSAPSATAAPVGTLVMIATPGKGLSAFFSPADGAAAVKVDPDMYDQDWGYGPPWFHMTAVEFRDPWIRLPEGPFPSGTWLNMEDLATTPITEWIEEGNILTGPFGDLYVLHADSIIVARAEQPADMGCAPGNAPPLVEFDTLRLGRDSLYTPTGHLRVKIKYTRGC